ncbi:dethiobiotin synthase [Xanthocytophaga flava]|uniref:dethiobiotin synthase n=1 Tax=Xanthocytophaga flava TaxID=3048013 RepID=UPI0028D07922|nr:dethiobiotin synthase [Xanthocytophaga flavus]MDJ1471623.1 dethiobiotin synthase [Xanthocytophaga flavus]
MHPSKLYFITAIGTDSGKTLISAIVTEALQADYWKPIQAGFPRDTEKVQTLVSNSVSQFHSEAYLLQHPMSPHAAAQREGVKIDIHTLSLPNTHNTLIIEGAGGVLVPVNHQHFVIDIAQKFEAEVILVANIYLGSINHTLLTINELKRRNIPVKGIIFNGPANEDSEQFILNYSQYPLLLHVYPEEQITPEVVLSYAQQLKNSFIV